MAGQEVKVPDIGDFKNVEVIEILVKPGDSVAKEQSLISLESDKATMDVPSPASGVVKELKVKLGDKVSQGSVVLTLEGAGAAAGAGAGTAGGGAGAGATAAGTGAGPATASQSGKAPPAPSAATAAP